jgi:hypothetical protein
MKSAYPLALEFTTIRERRFEREARASRGEVASTLAVAERERDLQRESALMHRCSQFCDLAIYGYEANQTYERLGDLEVEVVQAGLAGPPCLARSRMSAWKAAQKKAVAISWIHGKPRVARSTVKVTRPNNKARSRKRASPKGGAASGAPVAPAGGAK